MPLVGRRRPLMRAAMVGGAGYAVGKRAQRSAEHEAYQDEQLAQAEPAQPPPATAPAAAPMSESDRIAALKNLKDLLDSGVLTQAEFDAQKQRLLSG